MSGEKQSPESLARERKGVEDRLARAPTLSSGTVSLASGPTLDYRATCEYLPVHGKGFDSVREDSLAAVFVTAYEQEGVPAAQRPVCFAFNGGPGSCSLWLHLGALGPRRIVVPDDGSAARPPYAVVDNPLTWLRHFDLVFIDPPHTGWSIAAGDDARKTVHSVDGDVAAFVDVIRSWLTRHRRWGSPLYLAGESYGTLRGAAITNALLAADVGLAGVILVSCAMDKQVLSFDRKNDLPYAAFLPGYACVSQYHGLLRGSPGASPAAAREAAEAFVAEDYVAALHAGARLSATARARIAKRLAELTGLPRAFVEEQNLRIDAMSYFVEVLRHRGRQVGRLDARATAPLAAKATREAEFDPGTEASGPAYAMAGLDYYSNVLGVVETGRYEVLNWDALKSWDWNRGDAKGHRYCTTSDDLARALRRSPHLRVLVASGYYDLGTPYSASDWSLAQLDAPAEVLSRIEHHYYDAGHMMYTRQADLEKLAGDLERWLDADRPGRPGTEAPDATHRR